MSPFFVKKFLTAHKCSTCKDAPVSGYKMCEKHLSKARNLWRLWAIARKAIGRCIACDRKGRKATREHYTRLNGEPEQRCWFHAKLNTLKMKKWVAAHPNHQHEAYALMIKIRDAGFCPVCPGSLKRPLPEGKHRCAPCSIARSSLGRGTKWLEAIRKSPAPVFVTV